MKPHVLLVDDNDATLTLVTALLHRDFDLDQAIDGNEAVEKLKTKRYAAILLDLRMPLVDGFGVLDFLQKQQPETLARVLVVTAALSQADRERAAAYSVCAVIAKPFDVETLLSAVKTCASPDEPRSFSEVFSSGVFLLLADMLRNRF